MKKILLMAFLVAVPVKTEQGSFKILQAGRKIGQEDFSISSRAGGYMTEGHTRIEVGNEKYELRSRMELDRNLRPTFYEFESRGNTIRLKIGKPTTELETIVNGESTSQDIRFPEGGAIIDDNFFHHYLMLLYRFQGGESTIPVFVPQQGTVGTITIRKDGANTYDLETTDLKLSVFTDADGRLIRLSVPGAKVIVER